tara:strand:- start:124 stop:1224 length:1101 start_codon:yes stop_codon:yes gene_type:complete
MSEIKVNSIKGVSASTAAISIDNSSGTCTANITNNLSNRNLIINGSQIVSQRTTSATGKTTTGYYCTDRFRFVNNNIGTFTLAQSTDAPSGFAKSLRLDCTTADTSIGAGDYLSVDQAIEGFNVQQLDYGLSSAKSITISFYVKSTTTGTYTLEIYMNDGDYFNSKTYTISSANTWERKTITFTGNTSNAIADDNTRGLTCNFWLSNGSNFEGGTFSDGTWHNTTNRRVHSSQVNIASSTNNDWSITGVQLEVSSVATDFEHRTFGQELALCQRYFYRCQDRLIGNALNASDFYNPRLDHPVEMRASPSLSNGSFTAHSGNNGSPVIGNTRFVGGGGTLSVAIHNQNNNWSSGAWIKLTGDISAEL